MSTKVLKDQALESYYQALFQMYGTPGWQALMEDVERMRQVHDSVRELRSDEQLFFRQGELNQMDWLASHRDRNEAAYAGLLEEQEGEPGEVPTGGVAKVIE